MDLRRRRRVVTSALILAGLAVALSLHHRLQDRYEDPKGPFLVKPYIQWGDSPRPSGSLTLLWQGPDRDLAWSVAIKAPGTGSWKIANLLESCPYRVKGVSPRRLVRATLEGLPPGLEFSYRVLLDGAAVFGADARAPGGPGRPHRFVAFGDCGANTTGQKAIAHRASLLRPDYVMITGDLAYYKGRMSDYLEKFFPIYNQDKASPATGSPLLRSIPFFVAPGNHDLLERDLDQYPDALAYFLVWSLPRNGPLAASGSPGSPTLRGTEAHRLAFLKPAGAAYPRTANYSFDYGDVHWSVLDTNPYADWADPALRNWLERDLAAARDAPWRFVAFHQPPFHSSRVHSDEQRTRLLADLFEKHRVAIVFSGHIHNYQRSRPLKFVAAPPRDGRRIGPDGRVAGTWTLDRSFDGKARTRPDGVIYLVTGAGGARLYNTDQHDDSASWQEFTARFVSNLHSLTVVDVTPDRLVVRQLSAASDELDRIVITH